MILPNYDFDQAKIASPCVRKCCLDTANICIGCFRSLEEICSWSEADQQTRLNILANAKQRKNYYPKSAVY